MAALRIVPINATSNSKQPQFQSARTRCVNPCKDDNTDQAHVFWEELFVFEVRSGVRFHLLSSVYFSDCY